MEIRDRIKLEPRVTITLQTIQLVLQQTERHWSGKNSTFAYVCWAAYYRLRAQGWSQRDFIDALTQLIGEDEEEEEWEFENNV